MKATEQYFPVVLLTTLYKVFLLLSLWMKSWSVTIQMKATEQCFPVVLLVMLYKVVLTFESVGGILSVTIQMKATEQYFPVVLLTTLYKVVLTFESVDEILKCDHSNESYWPVLSSGAIYYAGQGGSNFSICR